MTQHPYDEARPHYTALAFANFVIKIEQLAKKLTDAEIAKLYGVCTMTIWHVRKKFKIPSSSSQGRRKTAVERLFSSPEKIPLTGETYVDENGLTITRYPARTAYGSLRHGDMVLPKRGR